METTSTGEQLLLVAEVCLMTRLSKSSVLREIEAGELEASRLGPKRGSIRVKRSSVDAYLERRAVNSGTAA